MLEALEASLLLFVVDASDPTYEAQLEVRVSGLPTYGCADSTFVANTTAVLCLAPAGQCCK
ncbi:MAG: hypothetical protein EBR45_11230 [Betaproteobacteria bacterium]|nr:hypothetical protein [Betaproteobacteria bacterium]